MEPSGRRFSNLSDLAWRWPPGGPAGPALGADTAVPPGGSLDLAAILEPGYLDLVRRRQHGHTAAKVRRTKSALETGLVLACHSAASLQQPVEAAVVPAVEEEQELPIGSDTDLAAYQEQLEEATAALLRAGEYLEAKTTCRQYHSGREEEAEERDPPPLSPADEANTEEWREQSLLSTVYDERQDIHLSGRGTPRQFVYPPEVPSPVRCGAVWCTTSCTVSCILYPPASSGLLFPALYPPCIPALYPPVSRCTAPMHALLVQHIPAQVHLSTSLPPPPTHLLPLQEAEPFVHQLRAPCRQRGSMSRPVNSS